MNFTEPTSADYILLMCIFSMLVIISKLIEGYYNMLVDRDFDELIQDILQQPEEYTPKDAELIKEIEEIKQAIQKAYVDGDHKAVAYFGAQLKKLR